MLGIIGGTGLYQFEGLKDIEKHEVATPFGAASSAVSIGTFAGKKVAFLPRHGAGHQHLPSEINFRANIWSLKSLGVTDIISVSATGSLKEEIAPGDLALPSQFVDWTKGRRINSFFGNGIVAHISSAHPVCPSLAKLVEQSGAEVAVKLHTKKTYVCVEGPRLGTQAESFFFRKNGFDLVGMTNVPEAFLALEAQMGYCTIAVATDYDCWHEDPNEHVTAELVISRYRQSIGKVLAVVQQSIKNYSLGDDRPCRKALAGALMTPLDSLTSENRIILDLLKL